MSFGEAGMTGLHHQAWLMCKSFYIDTGFIYTYIFTCMPGSSKSVAFDTKNDLPNLPTEEIYLITQKCLNQHVSNHLILPLLSPYPMQTQNKILLASLTII